MSAVLWCNVDSSRCFLECFVVFYMRYLFFGFGMCATKWHVQCSGHNKNVFCMPGALRQSLVYVALALHPSKNLLEPNETVTQGLFV